jgi:hypothetical protein
MSNLTHLAEANPVHLWTQTPRSSFSPGRARTESSPLLSDVPPKRRSDELPGRSWHRTSTADALEEFGAVVRHEAARTSRSNSYDDGRARGGSLGRDSRLFHSADSSDEEEEDPVNGWGVEIENVRLGEVSSLTGEGVEAMCRSISACLVDRKDKIERERTLRHKNSVMLTEATPASEAATAKHRFACCA